MKKITYFCDRCGQEITDVAYALTCYAEDVSPDPSGRVSAEMAAQNLKQNFNPTTAHLCRECKDKITDGVFVL